MDDMQLLASQTTVILVHLGVLLIVGGGIVMIIPWTPKRIAGNLLFYGMMMALLGSMGGEYLVYLYKHLMGLPLWVLMLVGGILFMSLFQSLLAIFLGWSTASRITAALTISFLKAIFWVVVAPFQGLRRIFRDSEE